MIRIIICGVNGRLGQTLAGDIANADGITVACGVDINPQAHSNDFPVYQSFTEIQEDADIIIDFSRPEVLESLLEYAVETKLGVVLATTGYSDTDKVLIARYASHIPVFFSANMSLGVNLQMALAKKAAEVLHESFDIEIIEKHHNIKIDAPSGTALALAEAINGSLDNKYEFIYGRHSTNQRRKSDEIGIHAVRGGSVVGEHDILFLGPDEVIEINHRAQSKQVFSQGAVRAAKFLYGKEPALYSMEDLLEEVL